MNRGNEEIIKNVFDKNKVALLIIVLCLMVCLPSCMAQKQREYYSERANYVNATGIVTHIAYNENSTALYFDFSELTPRFDDVTFKIVGDNLPLVQERGIDQKIKIGDKVEFISAPRYFGDGYVMPIVALSVNGEELLEFEEGFDNLLKWLG